MKQLYTIPTDDSDIGGVEPWEGRKYYGLPFFMGSQAV
jgi:hypothetical protein